MKDYSRATRSELPTAFLQDLRHLLDDSDTGFVSLYKFSQYMRAFGPLEGSPKRAEVVICQPWFHGYMSRNEATRMLEPYEPGTYFVRFASEPGSFALNFKDDSNGIYNIKIRVDVGPNRFCMEEGEEHRTFETLGDLVANYPDLLREPLGYRMAMKP